MPDPKIAQVDVSVRDVPEVRDELARLQARIKELENELDATQAHLPPLVLEAENTRLRAALGRIAEHHAHDPGCYEGYGAATCLWASPAKMQWFARQVLDEVRRLRAGNTQLRAAPACDCGHNPMIPSGAHIEGCPAYDGIAALEAPAPSRETDHA